MPKEAGLRLHVLRPPDASPRPNSERSKYRGPQPTTGMKPGPRNEDLLRDKARERMARCVSENLLPVGLLMLLLNLLDVASENRRIASLPRLQKLRGVCTTPRIEKSECDTVSLWSSVLSPCRHAKKIKFKAHIRRDDEYWHQHRAHRPDREVRDYQTEMEILEEERWRKAMPSHCRQGASRAM